MEIAILIISATVGSIVGFYYCSNKKSKIIDELNMKATKLSEEIRTFQNSSQNNSTEIIDLRQKNLFVHQELQSEKIKVANLEGQQKLITQNNENLERELTNEKTKKQEIVDQLNSEQLKSNTFKTLNDQLSIQLAEEKQSKSIIGTELENSKVTLNKIQTELTEASTKLINGSENYNQTLSDKNLQIKNLEDDIKKLRLEHTEISKNLTKLQEQEPIRIEQYNKQIDTLNQAIKNQKENEEKEAAKKETDVQKAFLLQKETWSRHEKDIEERLKLLCQQESITYIDKTNYPFTGKPDNCIKIDDEYVIFDSKSPQTDDLSNFPTYVRKEAENVKKYVKSNNEVKKEVFLVVPSNAISVIKETKIAVGEYTVYVVTPDALHPILVQLKKIEDYEFAEKLSPDDRDKIVSIIGRMAHTMKRSVQIGQFIGKEMISVLLDAENLPPEILEKAQAIEKASKLNPPQENRKKKLDIQTLKNEETNLDGKILGQSIHYGEDLKAINSLPLHRTAKDRSEKSENSSE